MASKEQDLKDEKLQALLDGELEAAESRLLIERIKADAALMKRFQAYVRQNSELHRLFDPVLDEEIPDRLLEILKNRGTAN